jgi:branched-chain amino acid transport system ATP-binding protein
MALLQLEGVSKRFGQVVVADRITFQLEEGASVGVVGPNGAGKTSMFGIISGDIKPDAGTLSFAGHDLHRASVSARCRMGIGRTYQVPQPFEHMTVFENALLAAQQGAHVHGHDSYEMAYGSLERVGLADLANRPAGSLALLHRKRLELARALSTNPRILLRSLQSDGIAILWIEHVVRALLSTVDRLLCLANGALVADGEPREVLASDAVRTVYLGGKIINERGVA